MKNPIEWNLSYGQVGVYGPNCPIGVLDCDTNDVLEGAGLCIYDALVLHELCLKMPQNCLKTTLNLTQNFWICSDSPPL